MATAKTTAKKAVKKVTAPSKKATVKVAKKTADQPIKKVTAPKKVSTVATKKAAASKKTESVAAKKVQTPKKAAVPEKTIKKSVSPKVSSKTKVAEKKAIKETKTKAKSATAVKTQKATKEVTKITPKTGKSTAKKTVIKSAPVIKSSSKVATKMATHIEEEKQTSEGSSRLSRRKKKEEGAPEVVIARRITSAAAKKTKSGEHNLVMEEFKPETKSILDGVNENSGPVYRYSDEDLNEFKELIISRLENARKELVYLQGLITRKDEAGTEDTDNRFNHMEDGSGAMEREQLAQLAGRQIQFISHLENAMVRIENKTYGICRVTGKLIDKARLRAVPHATLSIEAKMGMKK